MQAPDLFLLRDAQLPGLALGDMVLGGDGDRTGVVGNLALDENSS
jgi:hypothetical protein